MYVYTYDNLIQFYFIYISLYTWQLHCGSTMMAKAKVLSAGKRTPIITAFKREEEYSLYTSIQRRLWERAHARCPCGDEED